MFTLLSENATMPTIGNEIWIAPNTYRPEYLLYASSDTIIPPKANTLCATDVAIHLEPGQYIQVTNSFPMGGKYNGTPILGVIDPNYEGNIRISIFNMEKNDIHIRKGDMLCSIIINEFLNMG